MDYTIRELSELEAFAGARAQAWGYSCTLARLLVRLYWPPPTDKCDLYLLFAGCKRTEFNTHFTFRALEVREDGDGIEYTYSVKHGGDLFVRCDSVSLIESSEFLDFE